MGMMMGMGWVGDGCAIMFVVVMDTSKCGMPKTSLTIVPYTLARHGLHPAAFCHTQTEWLSFQSTRSTQPSPSPSPPAYPSPSPSPSPSMLFCSRVNFYDTSSFEVVSRFSDNPTTRNNDKTLIELRHAMRSKRRQAMPTKHLLTSLPICVTVIPSTSKVR